MVRLQMVAGLDCKYSSNQEQANPLWNCKYRSASCDTMQKKRNAPTSQPEHFSFSLGKNSIVAKTERMKHFTYDRKVIGDMLRCMSI